MKETQTGHTAKNRISTLLGILLCLLFSLILMINLTIIIKGSIQPDKPPSIFSITPLVTMSGSMSGDREGHIEIGDMIFVIEADAEKLAVGDVIAFMEPGSTSVVTHRIVEITTNDSGTLEFHTKGDANNAVDATPVTTDRLIGKYANRIAGVGNFSLFLEQPLGMGIFIGLPMLSFIIYDILHRQLTANKVSKREQELQAEIERLQAQQS